MSISSELKVDIYALLDERYRLMAVGTDNEARIVLMMQAVLDNCLVWPADKLGRWVGYVQCLLIEVEHKTTIEMERGFTRPLFQHLYQVTGIPIPESVTI